MHPLVLDVGDRDRDEQDERARGARSGAGTSSRIGAAMVHGASVMGSPDCRAVGLGIDPMASRVAHARDSRARRWPTPAHEACMPSGMHPEARVRFATVVRSTERSESSPYPAASETTTAYLTGGPPRSWRRRRSSQRASWSIGRIASPSSNSRSVATRTQQAIRSAIAGDGGRDAPASRQGVGAGRRQAAAVGAERQVVHGAAVLQGRADRPGRCRHPRGGRSRRGCPSRRSSRRGGTPGNRRPPVRHRLADRPAGRDIPEPGGPVGARRSRSTGHPGPNATQPTSAPRRPRGAAPPGATHPRHPRAGPGRRGSRRGASVRASRRRCNRQGRRRPPRAAGHLAEPRAVPSGSNAIARRRTVPAGRPATGQPACRRG